MGGGEAMAVIGVGTTSRASVEDVLEIIAAAEAKMETGGRPSPPSALPQGERGVPRDSPLPLREGMAAKQPGERGPLIIRLAALDRPALNGAVEEAARRAGLDLILLTLDELRAAAHGCVTHSEMSMRQYGIPSVAEAAALAAAGAGAWLFIPRFCGRNATASVAIAL
jgi:hypothetical protein